MWIPTWFPASVLIRFLATETGHDYYKEAVDMASRAAVDTYNDANDKNPKLEFLGVLKANNLPETYKIIKHSCIISTVMDFLFSSDHNNATSKCKVNRRLVRLCNMFSLS